MKIAVDVRELKKDKAGKGWYVFNVLSEIEKIDQTNQYIFYGDQNTQFPNWPKAQNVIISGAEIWWHLKVARKIKKDKIDLYFAPTSPIVPAITKIKTVMTVMDLTTFLYPEMHTLKSKLIDKIFLKRAINKTDKILCISKTTASDLIKYMPKAKGKTAITYLGYDRLFKKYDNIIINHTLNKYRLKPGYILFVGTIEPRKNITTLIKSYAKLDNKLRDIHPLVIVGKKGWLYDQIFQTVETKGIERNVKFLEYVPFSDLPHLYNGAGLFVYPSLYEGFGLPPLEAMASGLPVIVSDISSLPEVVGDAGILINPTDVNKLTKAMTEILNNDKLKTSLQHKSLAQAKNFSWAKTARETFEVFNSIK